MPYDLNSLVLNFSDNLTDYKTTSNKYNEDATRREYIDPFLNLLGWDVANQKGTKHQLREIITENYESKTERPDYTCTISGVKKFFIEAKKPSVNITQNKKAVLQARRYGFSAKHFISVLTNFEYLMIFDTTVLPNENDETHVGLIKKYHYTEYIEKFDEIKDIISRDAVFSGKYDNDFNKLLNKRDLKTVDEYFLNQINDWRLKLAQYLFDKGSDDKLKPSMEYINDITQSFINQMIFLRICEDRNLPLYHNLKETIQDLDTVKEEVFTIIEQADKRYNSGLFENSSIVMQLENEIVFEIIEDLYYPKSPYIFNVIESNLLGEIYEVFLAEKLVEEKGIIELVKVKRTKKDTKTRVENRDVVSTPIEIVKFIVEKTLSPLVLDKTPSEIYKLKIADISCGSGVFLLESFDFLINYVTEWYTENDFNALIEEKGGKFFLPLEIKKSILTSCIFGIDIDANAVEVAKFSLLLKLLEDESIPSIGLKNKILPYLDENILQGNALIDNNHLFEKSLSISEKTEVSPFDWQNNLPTFDAIIGNPPYVKTDDMKALLPKSEFEIYQKKYKTSYKQFDKYYIFIERSLEKLKDNGTLCLIIPNKFSKINSGERLRTLLSQYDIEEFIDFGSTQLFKQKNVIIYSSILSVKKQKPNVEFFFEEVNDLGTWWSGHQENKESLKRMALDSSLLTKEPWVLVANDREWELIDLLKKDSILLGDEKHFNTFNGVQTSAEQPPIYSFKENEIIKENAQNYYFSKNNKQYLVEKSITKEYFKPRRSKSNNIRSYDLVKPDMRIIFPYDNAGEIYSPSIMKNNYPGTWEYLNDFYQRLLPKQFNTKGIGRDVPHATKDTWYHYGRNQGLKDFNNTPKVIIGINTHRKNPLNLLDNKNMVIASGGTAGYCAVSLGEGSKYELEYLHAVLNHPAIVWLCSIMGSDFEGDFYSRGTFVLDRLPIKKIDFNDKLMLMQYQTVIKKTKEVYTVNGMLEQDGLSTREVNTFEREKINLIKDIQSLITQIYGIDHLRDIYLIEDD